MLNKYCPWEVCDAETLCPHIMQEASLEPGDLVLLHDGTEARWVGRLRDERGDMRAVVEVAYGQPLRAIHPSKVRGLGFPEPTVSGKVEISN